MSPEQVQGKLDRVDDAIVYEIVTERLADLEDLATHYIDAITSLDG